MKKIKLVCFAIVLLTVVLVLASCGAKSFDDLLDRDAVPADSYPTYTAVAPVPALKDMSAASGYGDLKLFTKYDLATTHTKYAVYDVVNDKIVWQKEESKTESATAITTVEYIVDMDSLEDCEYFIVTTITTTVTLDNAVPVKTTETENVAIWAWNGTEYAELVNVTDPRGEVDSTQDLLYFEGKVYRADEESKKIAYAFDYSALALFPELDYSTEDYYILQDDVLWFTYDKELNLLASYEIPAYAEEGCDAVIGNSIFVQYYVYEDQYGSEYNLIDEDGEKYTLHTLVIDAKTGKAEEIDTEYLVEDIYFSSSDEYWTEECGFASTGTEMAIAEAYKIENKRVNDGDTALVLALISENGKITALDFPTKVAVSEFYFIAKDTWVLESVDGRSYVIDGKGNVKCEIDADKIENSSMNYIVANGKLYDYSFNEVYDYQADKLEIERTLPKGILFTNADEELILYANGQKTTLINKTAAEAGTREYSSLYSSTYAGYFVIVDSTDAANIKYEIYNTEGKLLKTVENTSTFEISSVSSAKDGAIRLVKIRTWTLGDEKASDNYYRFT